MIHSPGYAPPRPIDVPLLLAPMGRKGFEYARKLADGVIVSAPPGTHEWDPCALLCSGTVLEPGEDHTTPRVVETMRPHVKALVGLQGYFPTGTAGEKATLFPYAWQGRPLPFGVVICSEAGIPSRARSEAALGANFLVNLVSEGEAGGYLRRNMLRVCSLRAVENRRPFVRVFHQVGPYQQLHRHVLPRLHPLRQVARPELERVEPGLYGIAIPP